MHLGNDFNGAMEKVYKVKGTTVFWIQVTRIILQVNHEHIVLRVWMLLKLCWNMAIAAMGSSLCNISNKKCNLMGGKKSLGYPIYAKTSKGWKKEKYRLLEFNL